MWNVKKLCKLLLNPLSQFYFILTLKRMFYTQVIIEDFGFTSLSALYTVIIPKVKTPQVITVLLHNLFHQMMLTEWPRGRHWHNPSGVVWYGAILSGCRGTCISLLTCINLVVQWVNCWLADLRLNSRWDLKKVKKKKRRRRRRRKTECTHRFLMDERLAILCHF